ncbi:uncharacterized protein EV420DRAFT_1643233 [Desarmillaria tabescens]|uniref:Uncharacterized protein n=1 Tax=Armillaria tabescens TaxID=1929756 RepID=A0AA39N5N8_ARMTA|nr:uncharacterized protein EV420DRAFT_1643233 [Desarmillaria tabescens]KAK0458344.1 hypothetical protein EV420DRAFT_1643233 [Desarmillaria tabescens]
MARVARTVLETVRFTLALQNPDALDTMKNAADSILEADTVRRIDWKPDFSSHVLLAACRIHETATELRRQDGTYYGLFTDASLRTLMSDQLEDESTFLDLRDALPLYPGQHPVMVGDDKNSLVWFGTLIADSSGPDLRRLADVKLQ